MRAPSTPDPRQFLGRTIDDLTIVAALHLGDGVFRFTLQGPDGQTTTHEVGQQ